MKQSPKKTLLERCFKDRQGRWAIVQFPNLLLWLWLAMTVVLLYVHDSSLRAHFDMLRSAALFAWAWFELTAGVNYFRKTLGAVVLVATIIGFFR